MQHNISQDYVLLQCKRYFVLYIKPEEINICASSDIRDQIVNYNVYPWIRIKAILSAIITVKWAVYLANMAQIYHIRHGKMIRFLIVSNLLLYFFPGSFLIVRARCKMTAIKYIYTILMYI